MSNRSSKNPTAEKCNVPPPGWECSREAGHNGPCAASPTDGDVLVYSRKDAEALVALAIAGQGKATELEAKSSKTLVQRLRDLDESLFEIWHDQSVAAEAADEIERLQRLCDIQRGEVNDERQRNDRLARRLADETMAVRPGDERPGEPNRPGEYREPGTADPRSECREYRPDGGPSERCVCGDPRAFHHE